MLQWGSKGVSPSRHRLPLVAVSAALALLLTSVAVSWATHLSTDTEGHTTVDQTICAKDPATSNCLPAGARNKSSYYNLRTAPGETYTTRELSPTAIAQPGRAQRRTSLVYFSQLTDFQLADEESPARVEFLDPTADRDPNHFAESAWRPQEALHPQMVDRMLHQVNQFVPQSPVAQGDGSRARMDFAITTGDSVDNQQRNEAAWVVRLLEGGALDPNSGSSNLADYANCPPGTPGPAEAARYTGVQDYNDYVEGPNPDFYDPNDPRGAFSSWPKYPGLMDRAEQPFPAEGLNVPSYVALGNHDGLVQGNAAANRSFEDVATGCQKEVAPSQQITDLQSAIASMTPAYLTSLAQSDPTKVALVPPDQQRQFVSTAQYKALHGPPYASQQDGHGFGFVDPAENAASNGAAAYYAWSPKPGFRFISLNTVGEGGVVSDRSSDGNVDDPQWRWLERELQGATTRNELIVVFGHHAINSLTNNEPDESGPPCTGTNDGHGHDQNPGCDLDPRISTPLHLGQPSQRPQGDTTETVSELLLRYPHVIAFVAGHSHVNQVLPFASSNGSGGFWNIKTAAEADWPSQSRLLDIMDNHDGTLSIFGTMIDHAAAVAAPQPQSDASTFTTGQLASLNREFAYNDPQKGGGTGEGSTPDRNDELLVPDPRRHYPRPRGATPVRVPLVPAYAQCTTPNRTHGAPLVFPSCRPPAARSGLLTVGTPDANGKGANSIGSVLFKVVVGDPATPANESDVDVSVSLTDVRRSSTLTDYTGEIRETTTLRITDRRSGPAGNGSDDATMVDVPLPVDVTCSGTADTSVGSTCSIATAVNALLPGAVREGDRAIWELGPVEVYDGGPDGIGGTPDNTLFARQGVFVP
jgi:hypothetical protein